MTQTVRGAATVIIAPLFDTVQSRQSQDLSLGQNESLNDKRPGLLRSNNSSSSASHTDPARASKCPL